MPKIGLISDTHDNLEAIDRAVKVFEKERVEFVLHAGDWNAPFALVGLARVKAKLIGVFGNIDGDREALASKAKGLGVDLLGDLGVVKIGGLRIAILHGKDDRIVEAIARSGVYDLVVRGHTHQPKVDKVNKTLIVNPGEACGYLTGKRSVAIFDVETRTVEFISF